MRAGISILIPTHNRVDLLERTLESLSLAAIPENVDIELVIVANRCTDDTVAKCHEWLARLPLSSRCVEEPLAGLNPARLHPAWLQQPPLNLAHLQNMVRLSIRA